MTGDAWGISIHITAIAQQKIPNYSVCQSVPAFSNARLDSSTGKKNWKFLTTTNSWTVRKQTRVLQTAFATLLVLTTMPASETCATYTSVTQVKTVAVIVSAISWTSAFNVGYNPLTQQWILVQFSASLSATCTHRHTNANANSN